MSELKATPGPWKIQGEYATLIFDDNEVLIARVSGAVSISENDANAHLIAAAPALYALVEEMMGCLDESMIERHDSGGLAALGITHSDECTLCKARKLLSAARGESEPSS